MNVFLSWSVHWGTTASAEAADMMGDLIQLLTSNYNFEVKRLDRRPAASIEAETLTKLEMLLRKIRALQFWRSCRIDQWILVFTIATWQKLDFNIWIETFATREMSRKLFVTQYLVQNSKPKGWT